MRCYQAHEEIDGVLVSGATPSEPLRQHLQSCLSCQKFWQDQAYETCLPEVLNVKVPPNLKANVMAAVAASQTNETQKSYKWPASLAVAVSLFLMILLGPFKGNQLDSNIQVVEVRVGQIEQVQLLVASAQDYQGANISVSMSAGMSLDVAGQVNEFNWKAPLHKGDNLLALPIYLMSENGGVVKVEFSSEEGTKQVELNVRAKPLVKDGTPLNRSI